MGIDGTRESGGRGDDRAGSADGRVDVRDEDGVRTVTIDRPARRNALTAPMYGALADALETAGTAGDVRVVLLRAEGGSFCAGNDLGDFLERAGGGANGGAAGADPAAGGAVVDARSPQGRLLHALAAVSRPMVVAVDGAAIGIGFTALLHADLVVATPRATFGAPFGQLGLCPEAGSSLLLPILVGRALAMEIFLLGRRLTADEALAHGLVNRLVEADDLDVTARDLALALAALPVRAVAETRRLVGAEAEPLPARIDRELEAFSGCLGEAETRARIEVARARASGAKG